MTILLKIEEGAMFCLGLLLFATLHLSWWWFAVLLLVPDIGMVGYLINSSVGAFTYNLLHHKAVAIGLYLLGVGTGNIGLLLAGVIMFAHSSMDRFFGFGLKYADAFSHTHLGDLARRSVV